MMHTLEACGEPSALVIPHSDLSYYLNRPFEELILTPKIQSQSRWLDIPPSKTIIACICLFEIIPIYGLLGYIPAIRRFGVFGLQVRTFRKG